MNKRTAAYAYLRGLILAVALALPALSLIPLGSLWLWQNGYLLHWALAACATTAAVYLYQRWLFRPARSVPTLRPDLESQAGDSAGEPSWSPREDRAWRAVLATAEKVNPSQLGSRDEAIALGLGTIDIVARKLHPEVKEPLWQFTVPEALALVEQVSRRLRPFIVENIPLGDQLTVAQVRRLYRWRGAMDVANRAYDVWRILRLANPVSAATQEAREALTKRMFEWGKDQIGRRLAEAYVKEVGRAAIDLYGGRLRVAPETVAAHLSEASRRDTEALASRSAEPLRILVVGQTGVGKSSLVNALAGQTLAAADVVPTTRDFPVYEIARDDLPPALIIDSVGFGEGEAAVERMIDAADASDLVIWVSSAVRADRHVDRQAMERFRSHFEARLDRSRPPVVVALSNVDRLRPFQEWSPPYDLNMPANEKARSITAAVSAVASDLDLPAVDIIPLAFAPSSSPYNLDALWVKIIERLPEAKRAQLLRSLSEISRRWDWRKPLRQAANAGRVIVRGIKRR